MAIIIETERLLLRQFTEEDAEALCAVCNQDDILKWMPDWQGTIEQKPFSYYRLDHPEKQ